MKTVSGKNQGFEETEGGRPGRPRLKENPLADYAEKANHQAIRLLTKEAVRREFNLQNFAKLLERTGPTVKEYFKTEHPEMKTVVHIARALNYREIVAHALMESLTAAEEQTAAYLLLETFTRSHRSDFDELFSLDEKSAHTLAREKAFSILQGLEWPKRQTILSRFTVSYYGLGEKRPLDVLAEELRPHGYDSLDNVRSAEDRQRAAFTAATWMINELGATHAERSRLLEALNPFFSSYRLWPKTCPPFDSWPELPPDQEKALRREMYFTRTMMHVIEKSYCDSVDVVNARFDEKFCDLLSFKANKKDEK